MPGFTEDWKNRELLFSTRVNRGETILLHYETDKYEINDQSEILVNQSLLNAIYAYVRMAMAEYRDPRQAQVHEQTYKSRKKDWIVQNWFQKNSPQTILDAWNKNQKFVPQ